MVSAPTGDSQRNVEADVEIGALVPSAVSPCTPVLPFYGRGDASRNMEGGGGGERRREGGGEDSFPPHPSQSASELEIEISS